MTGDFENLKQHISKEVKYPVSINTKLFKQ